ncbi:MAG TPA: hypothetical protein VMW19_20975 [Myxococcota bacterium]|nr:hypothetical protein [Myxococcota bacterium]
MPELHDAAIVSLTLSGVFLALLIALRLLRPRDYFENANIFRTLALLQLAGVVFPVLDLVPPRSESWALNAVTAAMFVALIAGLWLIASILSRIVRPTASPTTRGVRRRLACR